MAALRESFRPEFLNRIDDIIVFNPLTPELVEQIADIQVERLRERLAEMGLGLEVTPAARHVLAATGYDATYGARPLKRTIQREVENPLAEKLLVGDFADGDTVVVDAEGGEIIFERGDRASAAAD